MTQKLTVVVTGSTGKQGGAANISPPAGYWAVAFIAVLVVALTAHLGGILSGVEVPN